jgi:hypothetical protein
MVANNTIFVCVSIAALCLAGCAPLLRGIAQPITAGDDQSKISRYLFGLTLIAALVALRWPTFNVNAEIHGPEESQLIAGGLTLQHSPISWKSLDAHENGPLSVYPLLIASLVGADINYLSARFIAAAVLAAAIWFVYRIVSHWRPAPIARLLCLPIVVFLGTTDTPSFLVYSSTPIIALLLSYGGFLIVSQIKSSEPVSLPYRCFTGLIFGSVALVNVRHIAFAALLIGVAIVLEYRQNKKAVAKTALTLAVSFIGPLLLYSLFTIMSGDAAGAWMSYFAYPARADDSPVLAFASLESFRQALSDDRAIAPLAIGSGLFIAATYMGLTDRTQRAKIKIAKTAIGAFGLSTLIFLLSGNEQRLVLIAAALSLVLIGLFSGWWHLEAASARRIRAQRGSLIALFMAFTVALPIAAWSMRTPRENEMHVPREMLSAIHDQVAPGESLAVWGWMPRYYVLTGLAQATREAHVERLIRMTPYIHDYRHRFLQDLKRSQPMAFLDAIGPGNYYYQFSNLSHEVWPELADYIAAHYTLSATLDGARLYLRKSKNTD